jgi:hypothetical protein
MKPKPTERKRGRLLAAPTLAQTFDELYDVSLDYQKADGYWVCSHKEYVCVPAVHGLNEKNNHDAAGVIARKLYAKCRINSVTYC